MTPHQFIVAGTFLYGRHGWKSQLADRLGLHRATVTRYASGESEIPVLVAYAMESLTKEKASV